MTIVLGAAALIGLGWIFRAWLIHMGWWKEKR